jgi:hypothetical protein
LGDLFVSGYLASAAAVQCDSWSMEYARSHDGCSSRFENQSSLLLCSTPMHIGRFYMEDYDQAWSAILHRHSITNETIEKAKRKRMELLARQSKQELPIKESIIEQMQNEFIKKNVPIVPLDEMEQKLD